MRILVVSEDLSERQRATSALQLRAGVEIVQVETARTAAAAVADAEFDVLVIDGDLTPKGGFCLLYELRASSDLQGTRQVPAVVLADRTADLWLAKWARADATVPKPVDPFAVARIVEQLAGAPAPA